VSLRQEHLGNNGDLRVAVRHSTARSGEGKVIVVLAGEITLGDNDGPTAQTNPPRHPAYWVLASKSRGGNFIDAAKIAEIVKSAKAATGVGTRPLAPRLARGDRRIFRTMPSDAGLLRGMAGAGTSARIAGR
jgi:hypothetical protein